MTGSRSTASGRTAIRSIGRRPRCRELRSMADGEGIEIFAVAANNDFSNPVPEVREAQICFLRDLIRMTADLGAPTLRVFLAWWGVTRHPQAGHLRHRRRALADRPREIHHRGDLGLVPRGPGRVRPLRRRRRRHAGPAESPPAHQGSSRRPADGQGGRLSAPEGLPRRSPHARQERRPSFARRRRTSARSRCCRTSAANSSGGRTERSAASTAIDGVVGGDTNQYYRDFVRSMSEIGYEGYIGYELCHQLPVVDGQTVDIGYAHQNAQLAAEFMRELIERSDGRERQ